MTEKSNDTPKQNKSVNKEPSVQAVEGHNMRAVRVGAKMYRTAYPEVLLPV